MRRASNIYRLGVMELWSLIRDPMMLVLIVYTFTAAIYVAATAMPDSLHKAAIAIVDEDQSPLSGGTTPREHARVSAARDAGRAYHSLRIRGPGDFVPRRRSQRGVAEVPRPRRDRHGVLCRRLDPLPQDAQPDGLTKTLTEEDARGLSRSSAQSSSREDLRTQEM
jgi:hypothetical protein